VRSARQVERKLETMRCERCAGLVVAEHFIGGGTSIGGWAYCGWRCVNCGAIGLSGKQARILPYEVLQEAKNCRQSGVPSTKFRRP
jgi:hypothetical protein